MKTPKTWFIPALLDLLFLGSVYLLAVVAWHTWVVP